MCTFAAFKKMLLAWRRNWHGCLLHQALPPNDAAAIRVVVAAATAFLCSNEVDAALHCHSKHAHPIVASSARVVVAIELECRSWFAGRTDT